MGSCEVECGVGYSMWAVCMCSRWCVRSSVGVRVCCVDGSVVEWSEFCWKLCCCGRLG